MSRELDVRAARVMGLAIGTQCPCDPKDDIQDIHGWQWQCENCGTTGYIDRKSFGTDISHNTPILEYSTDWAAAGQVVEWMRERGWYVVIDWGRDFCWVTFGRFERNAAESQIPHGEAETPAEAICLAFLAAMEAQCTPS